MHDVQLTLTHSDLRPLCPALTWPLAGSHAPDVCVRVEMKRGSSVKWAPAFAVEALLHAQEHAHRVCRTATPSLFKSRPEQCSHED